MSNDLLNKLNLNTLRNAMPLDDIKFELQMQLKILTQQLNKIREMVDKL